MIGLSKTHNLQISWLALYLFYFNHNHLLGADGLLIGRILCLLSLSNWISDVTSPALSKCIIKSQKKLQAWGKLSQGFSVKCNDPISPIPVRQACPCVDTTRRSLHHGQVAAAVDGPEVGAAQAGTHH